jgi:hypothetical protein
MRLRHIVVCPLRVYQSFPHCITNGTIFEKKKLLNIKCVFWFSLQHFVWNISDCKENLARYGQKYISVFMCSALKLFLSDFNETWIVSTDFRKNTEMYNFMKIHLLGAEFFHADFQRDKHDEANSCFSQFYLSAKKKQNPHRKYLIYNHGFTFEILRLVQIMYKNSSSHCVVDMLRLCYVQTNKVTVHSYTLQFVPRPAKNK